MLRTAYDINKEHSPWRHADLNPHPDFTSYYVAWVGYTLVFSLSIAFVILPDEAVLRLNEIIE